MNATELSKDEYLPYFYNYIEQAGNVELLDGLKSGLENMMDFYKSIAIDKLEYRYANGKWTIKEIMNHLIGAERVFCYRAMRFARQDNTALLGFDENDYAVASKANNRSLELLMEEYRLLRMSTITLFENFDDDMLVNKGIAGSGEVSVRALGFLIIGHEKHHKNIIEERYL